MVKLQKAQNSERIELPREQNAVIIEAMAEFLSALTPKIMAIDDPKLRVARVVTALSESDTIEPEGARASFLGELLAARSSPRTEIDDTVLYLALAFGQPEVADIRTRLGDAAREASLWVVADWLDPPAAEHEREERVWKVPAYEKAAGRPLTLGERKSASRTRDADLIARALFDPHPQVIENLLENPRLRELQVIRLAARRPAPPKVFDVLSRCVPWMLRYPVRLALAKNPQVPNRLASLFVPTLNRVDGQTLARDSALPETRRLLAKRLFVDISTVPPSAGW